MITAGALSARTNAVIPPLSPPSCLYFSPVWSVFIINGFLAYPIVSLPAHVYVAHHTGLHVQFMIRLCVWETCHVLESSFYSGCHFTTVHLAVSGKCSIHEAVYTSIFRPMALLRTLEFR